MKRILFIIFFHFYSFLYAQQNLVPNYSFEQKIKCVNNIGEFTGYVAEWNGQGSNAGGGLSWFTSQCNSSFKVSVPDNVMGHQYAHTGISYAGILTYCNDGGPYTNDARSYCQVQLISPLATITKYCVVFYVNLADICEYECSDMGAYFSDSALYDSPTYRVKSNFIPQIANDPFNNPLTDTVNWMKIAGSFVAKGGEQYIIIGNFKDDANSSVDSIGSNYSHIVNGLTAYYYIDDVSVLEVIQAFAGADSVICLGGAAFIGGDTAVPGVSYHWLPTAGLTNPNAAQTYASPSVTTTYTLRVVNDSMKTRSCGCPDSVTLDSVTVSVYNVPITVCCSATITIGQSVTLNATPIYKYLWQPNSGLNNDTGQSVQANPSVTTTYTIIATNSEGCMVRDSLTIKVEPEPCGVVFIPDVFSPGGGFGSAQPPHNNILYVRGDCIATMDFIIFDRWGNKIFESQKQSEGWDGNYKGQAMNTGTYVWYLKATLNDGTSVEKKGNVALVR